MREFVCGAVMGVLMARLDGGARLLCLVAYLAVCFFLLWKEGE